MFSPVQKDFLIVLDAKDKIESIMPESSVYYAYINQKIEALLDEKSIKLFEQFKDKLMTTRGIFNFEVFLKGNIRCYFNGYTDQSSHVIIVLFESLSDEEVLKKMMIFNSQQLNIIRNLSKRAHSKDDEIFEQISKLNSELLNSKRIIEKQNAELQNYNNLLKKMSTEDSLTGCYNRRYFYDYMREVILSSQKDESKCLIMIDFNHFKKVNDQFGHDAGDRLLINFVTYVRHRVNGNGELFRLGGDEFIILTDHKNVEEANLMMHEINQKFTSFSSIASLAYGCIMFKVSDLNHDFEITSLIQKADELMYLHKRKTH